MKPNRCFHSLISTIEGYAEGMAMVNRNTHILKTIKDLDWYFENYQIEFISKSNQEDAKHEKSRADVK